MQIVDLGYDNVLRFEAIHPGTHILQSQAVMDEEMIRIMGSKKASEYILRKMAQEMAEHIIPMMDVRTEFDPVICKNKVRARLRVMDPTFRF